MEYLLAEGRLDPPADTTAIANFVEEGGGVLPADYLDFFGKHDGGYGVLGEHYFVFWKVSELIQFNREYEVQKYAPGIFLFGSNGGGEG